MHVLKEAGRKEGNVHNALNTFYLWLYGIKHGKRPHIQRERKPAATTTWATVYDKQQGSFICTIPQTG